VGEDPEAVAPSALYGIVLLLAAIAYFILQQVIIGSQGPASILKQAVGGDWKGKLSPLLYVAGALAACWQPHVAQGAYLLVALLWLIPDRRIELALTQHPRQDGTGDRGVR
jgi:uncharacterized membrane protein